MNISMKKSALLLAALLLASLSLDAQVGKRRKGYVEPEDPRANKIGAVIEVPTQMTPQDSIAFVTADWNWKKMGGNKKTGVWAGSAQLEMFGSRQFISIVKFRPGKHRLCVKVGEGQEDARTTSEYGRERGALAAANASYFNVKALTAVNFIKDDGTVIAHQTAREGKFRSNACLFIGKDGTLYITGTDGKDCEETGKNYHEALSAGPLLMKDGKTVDYNVQDTRFYRKRHPRTLVGYKADGETFLIVVDGRFDNGQGMTVRELSLICRLLGMKDAMNLDGGGSCSLWTKKTGVLNHPYDNHHWDHEGERIVPNALVIK